MTILMFGITHFMIHIGEKKGECCYSKEKEEKYS
jgi:hypothetical protein